MDLRVRHCPACIHPVRRHDPFGCAEPRCSCRYPDTEWRSQTVHVLQGIADGLTDREIGRRLHISEHTVKTHSRRLFVRLRARNRAHAVALGYQHGLLGPALRAAPRTVSS